MITNLKYPFEDYCPMLTSYLDTSMPEFYSRLNWSPWKTVFIGGSEFEISFSDIEITPYGEHQRTKLKRDGREYMGPMVHRNTLARWLNQTSRQNPDNPIIP